MPPDSSLEGKYSKIRLPNMVEAWTFISRQYIKEAVSNVEKPLQNQDGSKLSTKINSPLSNDYRPELDSSPGLDSTDAVNYQSLIGTGFIISL